MYTFSIDYLFNRVYDVLLSIRYFWYFKLRGMSEEEYLTNIAATDWDGLRDRGWLESSQSDTEITPESNLNFLNNFGVDTKTDTDGDGVPDIKDPRAYDPNNLTTANIKEIYGEDLAWTDHVRMFIGMRPRDFDEDGVPDSVEKSKGLNPNDADTDKDGLLDGEEIWNGTDPLQSDMDGDGVLDGRDAYPQDYFKYLKDGDFDTDGDRLGDSFEKLLGTNINMPDTDGDGLLDNIDPYPDNFENVTQTEKIIQSLNDSKDGVVWSIQNPFLSFLSDILSVIAIFMLPTFIFIFYLWFMKIKSATEHYEHLFHDAIGYKGVWDKKHGAHKHTTHTSHSVTTQVKNTHIDTHTHKPAVNDVVVINEPKPEEYVKHPRWAMVEDYMSGNHETLWRIGILEADNLLHDTLRAAGYSGADLGEMLKSANFRSIDLAWDAHKMRNRIAHEGMSFTLSDRDARRTFASYEAVFRELNVL